MDIGPIGLRLAPRTLLAAVAGIQHCLQHTIGQRRRQRPAQTRRRDPLQRQRDGAARDAQRPSDLAVAGATFVLQAQDLAYSFVASTLSRLPSVPPLVMTATSSAPITTQRSSACTPPRVADFKSEPDYALSSAIEFGTKQEHTAVS